MKPHPLALMGRALRGRATRSVLTVGGVAATTLLVLVLLAAHRGVATGVHAYAGQPRIDLWVAPAGADNLIRSSGLLAAGAEAAVASLPGVAAADPLLRSFVSVRSPSGAGDGARGVERKVTLLAIGYATPARLGGPPSMAEGREPASADEVALDRAAAHRLRVRPGDALEVNGRPVRVVGLTRGTNLLATQFLFSDIEDERRRHALPQRSSFLAVGLAPGADPGAVTRAIERRLPGTGVFERDAFVANNLREVGSGLLPLLALIAGLGVGVAAVLVVLLVQGLVEDRRVDIAVLLALGAGAGKIGMGLVARAGALVLAGGAVGSLLALGLAALLDRFVPDIELAYALTHFAFVLVLFWTAGMLAAVIPVLRLRRIDPLEAFRA
jgi:putative ABC transport system permease protein